MKQKSLKLNVIMNMILTMSSFIFPLITFPYVSRILLPEGTGKVSFATAQELLIINLIMSAISYSGLILTISCTPRLQSEKTLYVVMSFTIILNSIGMEWLYKALEQYTYITIRSLIVKVLSLIALFLLIHKKSDYIVYAGISVLSSSASYICNFINVHKYIGIKPIGGYNFKQHLKPIFTFFAMACATTIYTNLDTVMLGFMKTDTDVGYYNAAVKIKTILVSIVTSLGAVLLPRASYYIENGKIEEFKKITKKALSFVFLIATPLVLYFILFAKDGIFFLSGNAYEGSILPMQIIMPTVLFIGITNILGMQILVPLGKEKIVLYSVVIGAIVDVLINILLIPQLSSAGAALGTLIAEIAVFVFQYMVLKNEVKEMFKQIHFGRIIFALVLGMAASLWVKLLDFGNFMTLVISAILFFCVYGIYLLIRKEDMIVEIWNIIIRRLVKR